MTNRRRPENTPGAPAALEPPAATAELVAGLQRDLGLGVTVGGPDGSDAPLLPLDGAEPPGPSRLASVAAAAALAPGAFPGLERLARTDPALARAALTAALTGLPYDPKALPDARAFLVGLARVLVDQGVPVADVVESVLAAMAE